MREGLVASLALVPSVFVYGSVFGGLAVQAGLTPAQVLGMSVLVFAGAAQFVAVPMIAAVRPLLAIIVHHVRRQHADYLMAAHWRRRSVVSTASGSPSLPTSSTTSRCDRVARSRPAGCPRYLGSAPRHLRRVCRRRGRRRRLGGLVERPERTAWTSRFPPCSSRWSPCSCAGGPLADRGGAAAAFAVLLALVLPGNWHSRGRRPRGEQRSGARAAGGGAVSRVWLVIVGMAVATYLTRAPMFLALAHRPLRRACGSGCGWCRSPCCRRSPCHYVLVLTGGWCSARASAALGRRRRVRLSPRGASTSSCPSRRRDRGGACSGRSVKMLCG